MFGCLRSCLGKVVAVVLIVAAAYAGWRWGPSVFPRLAEWMGREEVEASPELAEATLDRYEAFQAAEGVGAPGEMSLGEGELVSVLRYALPGLLPQGVVEPGVEIDDGRIELSARAAVDRFPDLPDLGPVIGLLPDTVPLTLGGSLLSLGGNRTALVVDEVTASRIPVPSRMIPDILEALGRTDEPGLPADAIELPLPEGLRSVYIRRDSLVLVADR